MKLDGLENVIAWRLVFFFWDGPSDTVSLPNGVFFDFRVLV